MDEIHHKWNECPSCLLHPRHSHLRHPRSALTTIAFIDNLISHAGILSSTKETYDPRSDMTSVDIVPQVGSRQLSQEFSFLVTNSRNVDSNPTKLDIHFRTVPSRNTTKAAATQPGMVVVGSTFPQMRFLEAPYARGNIKYGLCSFPLGKSYKFPSLIEFARFRGNSPWESACMHVKGIYERAS